MKKKVSSRGNAVTGRLKQSGVELTIKVKKLEDWQILRDFYGAFSKELYNDLFPLLQAGYFRAYWGNKSILNEGRKMFLNAIRVLSSVIHAYYKRELEKSLEFHIKDKPVRLARELIMQSRLGDWARHHKVVHFMGKEFNTRSFYNDYILKGYQIKQPKKYLCIIKDILSPQIQKQSEHDKKILRILNKLFLANH